MKKQDINGVRSAQDLERKYDLKSIFELKENFELQKNGLNKVENELTEFVIATTNNLQEIQNQVDGNITTWFLSGVPTLNNEPTINWNTIEEKNNHLGDLYYDKETGYSYRFTVENEIYEWIKLTDSDITEALAIANSAKDTADSKRRVFVVQPIPPYDVGDLWINNEELYRCQTTKGKEEIFENNDWIVATKYTDDTVANQVGENLTILSGTVTEIRKDVDKLDTTMINTTELVNEQGKKVGLLEEKQSQTTQTVDEITSSVNHLNQTVNKIQTITNTLEGNPIKIENALENPLQKLVITGDGEITNDILKVYRKNEQLDYPEIEMTKNSNSGKNLINNILQSKIINGITIVVNADKSITLNGTSTSEFYPILTNNFKLENKQYTLSSIAEMQDSKIKMVIRQSTQNVQIVQLFSGNETTFNSTYTDEVYAYLVIRANQTFDNFTIYPMLVEGDLSTEYEPYDSHGGQYYADGIITQQTRSGKNLFDKNNINADKGVATSTGGLYASTTTFATTYIEIEQGDYVVNAYSSTVNRVYGAIYDNNKQYLGEISTNAGVKTFTINNENAKYIKLTCLNEYLETYQIERGTVPTPYEPYGVMPSPDYPSEIINKYPSGTYKTIIENKPYIIKLDDDLRSVGDVADRLWLDITNNTAEVEKKIGKIVLNGSENWQEFYMTKTNTNVFSINSTYLSNNYQNSYNKISVLSDYFKCYGLGTLYGNDDIEAIELNSNTSYSIQIGISKDIASSVSEFKQWLSEINTEVQYVLSIPLLQTIQMESIYQQYNLNISSLLTLNENKDEYVLENGKAIIIKKIGINEKGEKYVLDTPLISDLGQLYIQLANGVNVLEFLNNFNMEATYFIDNEFTRKFANQINSSSEFNEQNNLLNQNSNDINDLSNKLNNDYTNNSKLNQLLEGQKATIIEETSTMIEQSASEVTTSIINKVNTDGVTTLKNTLVTIDINGINVAKNDEDVVSLLDNKGLYVSDGKLKSDESNLLMKTDRNGAYFKSATIDGTIKEQGLFQKEVIIDDDFGKGQAGFWIGG